MAWQYPLTSGNRVTLAMDDDAFVGKQVELSGGISGAGSSHQIIVEGTVAGSIYLGGDTANDSGESIDVRSLGVVFSGDNSGLDIRASGTTIINSGHIESPQYDALYIEGFKSGVTTNIVNSGEMIGNLAIFANGTQNYSLINTGTITGTLYAYYSTWQNTDHILNSGVMKGEVVLGAGNDTYDGRRGSVKGRVGGGEGLDKLYGGKEANELHGDAGADKIYGAGGADKLYGGADADTFIYNAVSESTPDVRDKIFDYEHIDKIDLVSIDAKSSTSKNDAFTFIGNDAYGHHSGELRYAFSGSDTIFSGDVNGDGVSDFSVKMTGHVTLAKNDFLL